MVNMVALILFSTLLGSCRYAIADPGPSTLASCFVLNGVFNTLDLDAVMASTQISGSGMGATGSCTAVNL